MEALARPTERYFPGPGFDKVTLPHSGSLPIAPLLYILKTPILSYVHYVDINKGKKGS